MGASAPEFDVMSCNGCGACVSACNRRCLTIPNYTSEGLLEEVRGVLSNTEGDVAIVGFFDDNISYTAADNAGTARIHYPTNMRIVRMPSSALLNKKIVLETLGLGADGVMICEVEESHEAKLAETIVESVKEELKVKGIEPERIRFQPMVLPIFKMLPKFITDYTEQIKKLGKIQQEKRGALLNTQL
jgi:heterodisulfide reductase subunit A